MVGPVDMSTGGPTLVIDTATRASVVAVGEATVLGVSVREVQHRHGSHVLEQIDEVLGLAGLTLDDVRALGVGTGPGSFTGLRVGMATAKTIAYAHGLPLVGVMSSEVLRAAGVAAGADPDAVVVLPAGAHDHYLAAPDADPVLVAPGGLATALATRPAISLDMPGDVLGAEAARLGAAAVEGLPVALLAAVRARLAADAPDDVAALVPAYVALPRGVKRAAEELGWSPDLR
jgi:tRNA threonylcarbamoyl adenosine modification protein YeaZ